MHLEVLVEEPSAEAALLELLPKILGPQPTFNIVVYQGKPDLLSKLPRRLAGYRRWLPGDWKIVVLLDEDREDCAFLKGQLEDAARAAGFSTQSSPAADGDFTVLNRIAIEEIEALYFGEVVALAQAFERVPRTLDRRAGFRDPDTIRGGTWEALERVLKEAGHFPSGLPKIHVARSVAREMDPARNRSRSFQVFRDGLRRLTRR